MRFIRTATQWNLRISKSEDRRMYMQGAVAHQMDSNFSSADPIDGEKVFNVLGEFPSATVEEDYTWVLPFGRAGCDAFDTDYRWESTEKVLQ
jgi:hypothetical protein